MIERVLVPVDGSEMADRALEYALEVHSDANIAVLFVAGEPSPMMWKALSVAMDQGIEESAQDHAEEIFEDARTMAAEDDVELDTVVGAGNPARQIVEHAEDYDVVVIGSHGGNLQSRLFVGNVAERVFRRSPVPVTVVR
ncbi:MAG: nucleotide-binding universal stress UspA family protein [Halobacteriales archaeon]|jgi:nucleotide-binding universal stress UspA family protein